MALKNSAYDTGILAFLRLILSGFSTPTPKSYFNKFNTQGLEAHRLWLDDIRQCTVCGTETVRECIKWYPVLMHCIATGCKHVG